MKVMRPHFLLFNVTLKCINRYFNTYIAIMLFKHTIVVLTRHNRAHMLKFSTSRIITDGRMTTRRFPFDLKDFPPQHFPLISVSTLDQRRISLSSYTSTGYPSTLWNLTTRLCARWRGLQMTRMLFEIKLYLRGTESQQTHEHKLFIRLVVNITRYCPAPRPSTIRAQIA